MKNQKKLSAVIELIEFIKKSSHLTLLKFEKTSHIALEGLRKELKKSNAKIRIVKNSIFIKALNKLVTEKEHNVLKDFQSTIKSLKENTAVLSLNKDWSDGLNVLNSFTKKDKSITFKVGYLDGTVYNKNELEKIASLPGKNVLVGQIVGSMKNPLTHFTYALKYNSQKLVYILNTKAKKE